MRGKRSNLGCFSDPLWNTPAYAGKTLHEQRVSEPKPDFSITSSSNKTGFTAWILPAPKEGLPHYYSVGSTAGSLAVIIIVEEPFSVNLGDVWLRLPCIGAWRLACRGDFPQPWCFPPYRVGVAPRSGALRTRVLRRTPTGLRPGREPCRARRFLAP